VITGLRSTTLDDTSDKDIEIVFDDVLIEQKTLGQLLIDTPQAVRSFLFVKLFELLREITLGIAEV